MLNAVILTFMSIFCPLIYANSTVYGFARVGQPFLARLVLDDGLDPEDEFLRIPTEAERSIVLLESDYWLQDVEISRSPVDDRVYYLESRNDIRSDRFKVLLTEVSSYRRVIHEYSFDIRGGENQLTSRFVELPAITNDEPSFANDIIDESAAEKIQDEQIRDDVRNVISPVVDDSSTSELLTERSSDISLRNTSEVENEVRNLEVNEILLDNLTKKIAEYLNISEFDQPNPLLENGIESLSTLDNSVSSDFNGLATFENQEDENQIESGINTRLNPGIIDVEMPRTTDIGSGSNSKVETTIDKVLVYLSFINISIFICTLIIISLYIFNIRKKTNNQKNKKISKKVKIGSEFGNHKNSQYMETRSDTPLALILAAASKYENETNRDTWQSMYDFARHKKLEEDKSILLEAAIKMQNNIVSGFSDLSKSDDKAQDPLFNDQKKNSRVNKSPDLKTDENDSESNKSVNKSISPKQTESNDIKENIPFERDLKNDPLAREGKKIISTNKHPSVDINNIEAKKNTNILKLNDDEKNQYFNHRPKNIPSISTQMSQEITLAKVYLGMGEKNSARSILENLKKNGSAEERVLASDILKSEFTDE